MNKAALKRMALELRGELGLSPHDRFDPLELAELYGVDVVRLSEIECSAEALHHFRVERPEAFSGALVPLPDGSTVIVENDWHVPERRISTASHEMAHVTPVLRDSDRQQGLSSRSQRARGRGRRAQR